MPLAKKRFLGSRKVFAAFDHARFEDRKEARITKKPKRAARGMAATRDRVNKAMGRR